LTEQEIRDMGVRCALRHMDSLRIQAAEKRMAEFIEPCETCPEIVKASCFMTTESLMQRSFILSNMA